MDMKALHDMFTLGVPLTEKIIRPIVVYVFLIAGLRLSGKRELAQLNPFDLVVLLTISNTVQNAIIGDDNSISGGIIGASTLLIVNHIVVRYLFSHEKVERVIEGDVCVLIDNGVVNHVQLRKELITKSELEAAAHKQGFGSLTEIDRAVLDSGGGFSFVPRQPAPETRRHQDIIERLDQLAAELARIKTRPSFDAPPPAS